MEVQLFVARIWKVPVHLVQRLFLIQIHLLAATTILQVFCLICAQVSVFSQLCTANQ